MSDTKTVIVTGGARGIGKAVVAHFCGRGAHVIIADRLTIPERKPQVSAIAFLVPDDASYITGAVLTVAGGYSLG